MSRSSKKWGTGRKWVNLELANEFLPEEGDGGDLVGHAFSSLNLDSEDPAGGRSILEVVFGSLSGGVVPDLDSVLNTVFEGVAEQIGLNARKGSGQTAAVATYWIIAEVAEHLFFIGSGAAKLDFMGLKLAKMERAIADISKKLDIILYQPLNLAKKNMQTVTNAIQSGQPRIAAENLRRLEENTRAAMNNTRESKDLENMALATRLFVFSVVLVHSWDEDRSAFSPFFFLARGRKGFISGEILAEQVELISLRTEADKKLFTSKKEKKAHQDTVDKVLQISYEYVSEGEGWTSALERVGASHSFLVHPQHVPEGEEDSCTLTIGTVDQSLVRVRLWRTKYKLVLAGVTSREVMVELAFSKQMEPIRVFTKQHVPVHEGTILLSSNGPCSEFCGHVLGSYKLDKSRDLAEKVMGGEVVYGQQDDTSDLTNHFLYRQGDQGWVVTDRQHKVYLRNSDQGVNVPGEGWQYLQGGDWVSDDQIQVHFGPLDPSVFLCKRVTVSSDGGLAKQWPNCLGQFEALNAVVSGRRVFRNQRGLYLRVHHSVWNDRTVWCISDKEEGPEGFVVSGSANICPANPAASSNTSNDVSHWRYSENKKWIEDPDIRIECDLHSCPEFDRSQADL